MYVQDNSMHDLMSNYRIELLSHWRMHCSGAIPRKEVNSSFVSSNSCIVGNSTSKVVNAEI